MTFRQAVDATPSIRSHLREGLQALRAADRHRVSCSEMRRLQGSVDLDTAMRASEPRSARWDYAIGLRTPMSDFVVWLEVHPACSSDVAEVIAKLR
jgi:hypothetical protein